MGASCLAVDFGGVELIVSHLLFADDIVIF